MEKNKKYIIWVLIAIIAVISFFLWYKKGFTTSLKDLETGKDYDPSKPFTDVISENKVLRIGNVGNTVKELQREVNRKLFAKNLTELKITVDGVYGIATNDAIQAISGNSFSSEKQNVTINNIKSL